MSAPEAYNCEQVFQRLDDFLDRELSAEEMERVSDHLAACVQCATEYRFESQLLNALKEKLGRLEMPESLSRSVFEILLKLEAAMPEQSGDGDA